MLSSVGRGDGEARGGVCVLILNGGFGRDIFVRPLCNSSPGNYK